MEPALDERGDLDVPGALHGLLTAAMEPALDERGDEPSDLQVMSLASAAMEPALDERGDPTSSKPGANATAPQWSPLSTSGATLAGQGYQPARNDRRNGARSRRAGRRATTSTGPVRRCAAAMEPALDERGDQFDPVVGFGQGGAAMEPALDERGDSTGNIGATPPSDGRNGARSRRAGRRPAALTTWLPPRWPQWSPLSTSGATRQTRPPSCPAVGPQWSPLSTSGATRSVGSQHPPHLGAAMEPALDEWGDRRGLPSGRGGLGRNGARSRRAGRLDGRSQPHP